MKKIFTFLLVAATVVAASAGVPAGQRQLRKAVRQEHRANFARFSDKKVPGMISKASLVAGHLSRTEAEYDWQPLWPDVLSFISKGSVAAPVEIGLDENDNIPESTIGAANYGFGGSLLYEAGEGTLLLKYSDGNEEGMLWTPDATPGDIVCVEFEVRTAEDGISGCEVDFVACDYEGGLDWFFDQEVSDQWKKLRYVIDTSEYDTDVVYFQLWPYAEREEDEHDILIRNMSFEYVPAPPVEPIGTVENVAMSLNVDGAIDVSWSAAAEANYYVAEAGRVHPLAPGSDFTLGDADFSVLANDGTLESPIEDENLTAQVESFPGAIFLLPAYINGAMGLQDDYFYYYFMDYTARLESGIYDLSVAKNGEIRFSLDVCSGTGANLTAELYNWNSETEDWQCVSNFVRESIGTDFARVTFSLSGASDRCFFVIYPSGGEDYDMSGNLFFRSVKAEITMATDAEEIALPVLTWEGEATGFTIESPVAGDTYFVSVTPYQINADYEIIQEGVVSETEYFAVPTQGIGSVESDASEVAPVYYNLQGVKVAAPSSGVYIEVRGNKAVKVFK